MTLNYQTEHQNKYFLMRHGQSLANRRKIIVSKASNALDQYGLTGQGSEQVAKAALRTRLNHQALIVSSDFRRARETAQIMATVLDVSSPIVFDARLRERDFGDLELRSDSHYESVWAQDLCQPLVVKNAVETVLSVALRTQTLLSHLDKIFQNRSILLVGHGDVLQIMMAVQNHLEPRFHRSLMSMANADIRFLKPSFSGKKQVA